MSTQDKQNISGFEPYVEKKGEEYMGEPMREHFTKVLNAWKQDLMEGVDKTVDHMKEEAANFADPADRASQEEEFALELRSRDRERKLMKIIMWPSLIVVWVLGLALAMQIGAFQQGWFHAKLALVLALTGYHFWLASYALYLLAVFFPQSSTFRLLAPLFPALGAIAAPKSKVYRVIMVVLFIVLQWGWLLICWRIDGYDWSPP